MPTFSQVRKMMPNSHSLHLDLEITKFAFKTQACFKGSDLPSGTILFAGSDNQEITLSLKYGGTSAEMKGKNVASLSGRLNTLLSTSDEIILSFKDLKAKEWEWRNTSGMSF